MPGAPVPLRSVQYGASTPLGGVGSGSVWGTNVMSLALVAAAHGDVAVGVDPEAGVGLVPERVAAAR